MTQPFAGIRIIDATHVLAGPFAAYQLALMGAEVIKVEPPTDPDQSRDSGPDWSLNDANMGSYFLTQGSNKRAMTLDLKQAEGVAIMKALIAKADVLVENFRPGAFEALGLGWDELSRLNPRLIYCSISAFGQGGPRGGQTAYDHVIQSTSGIMAATGTPEVSPLKLGAPAIDYATGTMGAFALASALFQRERTGKGQRIDLAMLDVALMMQASHITAWSRTGKSSPPKGNDHAHATNSAYPTKDGLVMLGASNLRQQARLWAALGRPEQAKKTNKEREVKRAEEAALLRELMLARTAQEWEEYLQSQHVPASRVRPMHETMQDPHLASRGLLHRFESMPGVAGSVTVPVAAFKLAHGGPAVTAPPPMFGQHTDEVLAELGHTAAEITALRGKGVV